MFPFLKQGGNPTLQLIAQRRGLQVWLISGRDAFWTYLLGCGVYKLLFNFSGKVLVSSDAVICRFDFDLSLWPFFLLKTSQAP